MPSEVFVIDFSGNNVLEDSLIFHTVNLSKEDIIDFFSDIGIVVGITQHFSTDINKILYYAIVENSKKSLLGIIFDLEEEHELFETPLLEEAELLLRKDRDENFFYKIKLAYQRIIQKALKSIEGSISELDKEKEENTKNVEKLEVVLNNLYNEEKELLVELEKGEETDSIMEKIEEIITKQKQLEEIIKTQKNLVKINEEKFFNLKNMIMKLQEFYDTIREFTFDQSLIKSKEIVEEQVEEQEIQSTTEEVSNTEILDLKKKLEILSSKRLAPISEPVSTEETSIGSEATSTYNKKVELYEGSTDLKISLFPDAVSETATISGILAEKVGKVPSAIMEYLFWLKKPRTIVEISQDLEIPLDELREQIDAMAKNVYICKITKRNIKEIYLTVCPNCPLQSKCGKKRVIDWNQILSKVKNV